MTEVITWSSEHSPMNHMPSTKPTQRFSARVDNYVRYRPTYPEEVLSLLRRETGLTDRHVITL